MKKLFLSLPVFSGTHLAGIGGGVEEAVNFFTSRKDEMNKKISLKHAWTVFPHLEESLFRLEVEKTYDVPYNDIKTILETNHSWSFSNGEFYKKVISNVVVRIKQGVYPKETIAMLCVNKPFIVDEALIDNVCNNIFDFITKKYMPLKIKITEFSDRSMEEVNYYANTLISEYGFIGDRTTCFKEKDDAGLLYIWAGSPDVYSYCISRLRYSR